MNSELFGNVGLRFWKINIFKLLLMNSLKAVEELHFSDDWNSSIICREIINDNQQRRRVTSPVTFDPDPDPMGVFHWLPRRTFYMIKTELAAAFSTGCRVCTGARCVQLSEIQLEDNWIKRLSWYI